MSLILKQFSVEDYFNSHIFFILQFSFFLTKLSEYT